VSRYFELHFVFLNNPDVCEMVLLEIFLLAGWQVCQSRQ